MYCSFGSASSGQVKNPGLLVYTYKQHYGEACNNTNGCDFTKWLICSTDSVCECVEKDHSFYNETLRTCVALAYTSCVDYFKKVGDGTQIVPFENRVCISGATCRHRGMTSCYCDTQQYFQTEDGFCDPLRDINEPCDDNKQCKGLLECGAQKICTCSGAKKWDVWTKKCVASVIDSGRGTCADSKITCGRGADCQVSVQNGQYTYQCNCRPGYKEMYVNKTRDGHCYGQHGASCISDVFDQTAEHQCLPGLHCVGDHCQCKYGSLHQVYDFETDKCLSLLGSPCEHTSDCRDPNTECRNFTGISQCSCQEGFVEFERKCYQGYGQKCRFIEGPECDKSSGLECSYKGICECPELQGFNNISRKCVPLVGAICSLKDWKNPCWPGSVCIPFRGMENSENGLCVCETGFTVVRERKCYS